ncbi:MAG TPA: sigma-70 family RNA polymerase sigma factor [Bacteroidetes bacterium]|nr:sigma-70 family RNA polymerase sigma factor [Bacteroidota bacterium]
MIFIKNKPTPFARLDDRQLVLAIIREKDKKKQLLAQEELYGRYAEKVYFKCLTLVKDGDTAKDLTQDILVKMFLKLIEYRGEGTFRGWLFSMVYNHCINYLKKQKRFYLENDSQYDIPVSEVEAEHQQLLELRLSQLQQFMAQLNEAERLILLLRYTEGLSVKQMAQALGISESAVKMRLKRSRDHLAKLFENLKK